MLKMEEKDFQFHQGLSVLYAAKVALWGSGFQFHQGLSSC